MAVSQELLDAHLRKRGLDPAAWEYDEATDEFVQREAAPVKPSFMERMHKPMVDMEDLGSVVSRVAPSLGAEIKNRLEPVPGDDVLNSTLKGIYNTVGGAASGLTSKANLALLGASVVPGLQLPAAAAFVGMGAKGGAEAVKKIATRAGEWSGGGAPIGVQEGIELGGEGALNLAGVLAGRHLATKAADKSAADFSAMEQARKVQAEAEAIAQAKEPLPGKAPFVAEQVDPTIGDPFVAQQRAARPIPFDPNKGIDPSVTIVRHTLQDMSPEVIEAGDPFTAQRYPKIRVEDPVTVAREGAPKLQLSADELQLRADAAQTDPTVSLTPQQTRFLEMSKEMPGLTWNEFYQLDRHDMAKLAPEQAIAPERVELEKPRVGEEILDKPASKLSNAERRAAEELAQQPRLVDELAEQRVTREPLVEMQYPEQPMPEGPIGKKLHKRLLQQEGAGIEGFPQPIEVRTVPVGEGVPRTLPKPRITPGRVANPPVEMRPGTGPGNFFAGDDLPRIRTQAGEQLKPRDQMIDPAETANVRTDQLVEAYDKLSGETATTLRKYFQHKGKGTIGESSFLEQLLKEGVPTEFLDKAKYEAVRLESEKRLDALVEKNRAFNETLKSQAQAKYDSLPDASRTELTDLIDKVKQAYRLKKDLDSSPRDYPGPQRAAATRAYNKLMDRLGKLEQQLGITAHESGGMYLIERKPTGGGLRVGEALAKNERGEGGAVSGPDFRAKDPFLDSRKMLGSLREAITPNLGRVRIPVLQSTLQKIHGMNTKAMKIAGDTISEVFGKRVKYVGQYENRITDALRPLSAEQANGLREALESMTDTGTHTAKSMLDPAQQAAYEQIRTVLADQADAQIAAGQLVQDGKVWRERGKDPFYFPQIASRHVLRIIKNEIHSPEGQRLAKDYIDHRMNKLGETAEQAQAHLDEIAGAIDEGGMISPANAAKYGAVRKAEGAGLPKSWREQNLDTALRKYTRKFGSDRAFHDVIEKNPDAMHVLGMTHDLQGNPIVPKTAGLARAENMDLVRNAMREFMGHMDDPSSHLMAAAQRLFSAGAINVMGKVHDIGSVTTHLAAHLPDPVLDLPGMHAAIADTAKLAKAQANAIANGLIVKDISARQIAMNALKGIEQRTVTFAETMSEAGRMLNEINQNNRLEMYARTVAQAGAEYVVGRTMELAKAGEPASIKSLERWAPDWRNMTEDQIATRVAELVQGTYDVRGQPYIAPEWRPYTGLARWGIEQANNAAEFMIEPLLKEGKAKPLFAAVGTAYLMGTALNELRKGLTGRQGNMPTQEEVDEATPEMKNKMQAYRALALIESMGVGGMVTSLTKGLVDEVMMKMDARGIKYPTYEAAADMAKKTTAMSSALIEGEDPMEVLQQYSTDMLMSSVGTLRYAVQIASHLTGEDMPGAHVADVQRMEDYRNKRMHDITQGQSFRPLQRPKPDYSALSVREFKRTGDADRAKELLPKVIDRAVRRAHGDAQLLDEELSSLRRNNIQSFPNMDVNPEQAAQYYQWLVKTKGKAVADAALARYRLQNALNNAKRDAIPQLR